MYFIAVATFGRKDKKSAERRGNVLKCHTLEICENMPITYCDLIEGEEDDGEAGITGVPGVDTVLPVWFGNLKIINFFHIFFAPRTIFH